MLFVSEFFTALTPNPQTAQGIVTSKLADYLVSLYLYFIVLGGLFNTLNSLFCGFLIAEQSFPTFWLFMYWLNPVHYALEGLIMSQFKDDTTPITTLTGGITTAEDYMTEERFSTWSYDHIGYDVMALCLFISAWM